MEYQWDPQKNESNLTNSSSEISLKAASRTDWKRLDALTQDEIDTSDSPPPTEAFLARARWLMPGESSPRRAVRIELEPAPNLLAWFQAQGQDYERRVQAALRLSAEAHEAAV